MKLPDFKNFKIFNFLNKIDKKNLLNFQLTVLSVLTLLAFCVTFLRQEKHFYIPEFGTVNDELVLNVEMPLELTSKVHFIDSEHNFENTEQNYENNVLILKFYNTNSKELYLSVDDESVLDSIKNVVLNLNNNLFYYTGNDIKNFEKTDAGTYIFPADMKYSNLSGYITDKGIFCKAFVMFMALFYNTRFFFIPLILLGITVLFYLSNKENFNFKFNLFKNSAIIWIVFAGAFLRMAELSFPYSISDLYSINFFENSFDLYGYNIFNPPLYYFILKNWINLFGTNNIAPRLLSCIFSVCSIAVLYTFLKNNVNEKVALLASFLFSVNVMSIFTAQELKPHSFAIFLALLSSYFLFEIIHNKRNKDIISYSVVALLMINTHFYLIFLLIINFIFVLFISSEKKLSVKVFVATILPIIFGLILFSSIDVKNVFMVTGSFNKIFGYPLLTLLALIMPILLSIPKLKDKIIEDNSEIYTMTLYSFYSISGYFIMSLYFVNTFIFGDTAYNYVILTAFEATLISCLIFLSYKNDILKYISFAIIAFYGIFYIPYDGKSFIYSDYKYDTLQTGLQYSYIDQNQYNNKKIGIIIPEINGTYVQYATLLKGTETLYSIDTNDKNALRTILANTDADVIYIPVVTEHGYTNLQKWDASIFVTDRYRKFAKLVRKEIN